MIWLVVGGFVLLLGGGEALVRGASSLATRLGVSPLIVGISVVGFGTSAPELVTSIQAAWQDLPGLAIGNIVGSNIANILLVLGMGALISPLVCERKPLLRDGGLIIAAALLLWLAAYGGTLTRMAGIAFLLALAAYLYILFARERNQPADESSLIEEIPDVTANLGLAVAYTIGGTLGIIIGSKLLIEGSVQLAGFLGIGEEIIGLTVVAIGTSLPELATSIIAAYRNHSEIAFGNVLGSNVYNVLGIGGVTATLIPLQIPSNLLDVDIPLMTGITIFTVVLLFILKGMPRLVAALFLISYGWYVTALLV